MSQQPDRRDALLAAKLGALVRGTWPDLGEGAGAGSFPDGSTLIDAEGRRGWVLLEADAARRVGAVLAWSARAGISELHLLVDDVEAAPVVARRAGLFGVPPTVWTVDAPTLTPTVAAPPALDPPAAPEAEELRPDLILAGLDPVVEAGNLIGELRGLEVARVVVDADGAHIEAGVGRFDREIGAMMFAQLGEVDALARVVDLVSGLRRGGADRHPLNQLVPERWLRSVLVAEPDLVGAAALRPVGSALARRNLLERGIATAVGIDEGGLDVVVTCSTGVDLELVASAADDRLTHAPEARLILAVPERDALAVTTELADHLRVPAEVRTLDDRWQDEDRARLG